MGASIIENPNPIGEVNSHCHGVWESLECLKKSFEPALPAPSSLCFSQPDRPQILRHRKEITCFSSQVRHFKQTATSPPDLPAKGATFRLSFLGETRHQEPRALP